MENAIQHEVTRHERSEEKHRKMAAFARRFAEVEGVEYFFAYEGAYKGMTLDARVAPENAIKAVSGFLRVLGEKSAEKKFDETRGIVSYVIKSEGLEPFGSLVIEAGKPKYCEMEAYEVEEEVPAQPAHVEKKTKYRLVDPACLEAMK